MQRVWPTLRTDSDDLIFMLKQGSRIHELIIEAKVAKLSVANLTSRRATATFQAEPALSQKY